MKQIKISLLFASSIILLQVIFVRTLFAVPSITVGIVQIVQHPALEQTQKGVVDTLKASADFSDIKIITKQAQGSLVTASSIAQKFTAQGVDVIVAIGTGAAQAAAKIARRTQTPVVFSSVTDPLSSGLMKSLEKPASFVTGVSNATPQKPQLLFFKSLLPKLKKVGVVYNPGEANSVILLESTSKAAREIDMKIIPRGVTKTPEVALAVAALIGEGVEAIFVNNDNTALAAFDVITQIAGEAGVPVFVSDTDYVQNQVSLPDGDDMAPILQDLKSKSMKQKENAKPYGALAALGPNQYDLGIQTGKIVLDILSGKQPQDIPVQFPKKMEKVVNGALIPLILKK